MVVEPSLHPLNKAHLIVVYDAGNVLLFGVYVFMGASFDCISVVSFVMSPFSFIVLLIWVLSFLSLANKGLSFLLSFSRKQYFG